MPAMLEVSQCLVRDSTLALPDNHLAWVTALETSYGEEPHVVKRGCVLERDMKFGSKYLRDPSLRRRAWERNFFSQKSRTADLTSLLKVCLVGGLLRKVIGWGSRYFREIFWISRNQEWEEGFAEASMFLAWEAMTLSPP